MKRMRKAGLILFAAVLVAGCTLLEKPILSRRQPTGPVKRPYVQELKTITVNNLSIAYMEAGMEGPWVVLIHGGVIPMSAGTSFWINPLADLGAWSTSGQPISQAVIHAGALSAADTWNYNLQAIADAGFRVAALDLPGFGASDKPDMKYTVEDFVLYLEAFLKAKNIDRAALVGHGLGGEIALAYTLSHPEQVDRLVLADSFGACQDYSFLNLKPRFLVNLWQGEKAAKINIFLPLYPKIFRDWKRPQEGAFYQAAAPQIKNPSPRGRKSIFVSREGRNGEFLKAQAAYKLQYISTDDARKEVRAVHRALPETRRRDFAGRLGEVKVPVLIIRGFYDPVVSDEEVRFMASAFPKAQLIIYQKSGHYPMVEEADRFNHDVIFFLSAKNPGEK